MGSTNEWPRLQFCNSFVTISQPNSNWTRNDTFCKWSRLLHRTCPSFEMFDSSTQSHRSTLSRNTSSSNSCKYFFSLLNSFELSVCLLSLHSFLLIYLEMEFIGIGFDRSFFRQYRQKLLVRNHFNLEVQSERVFLFHELLSQFDDMNFYFLGSYERTRTSG